MRPIGNPTAIYQAIEAVAVAGVVTPDNVVIAARSPDSVLHPLFPWNDAFAAHQHRLAIARNLIRTVSYTRIELPPPTVREITYVHDPRAPPRAQGYIPLQFARRSPDLSLDILFAELNRVESAIARMRGVANGLGWAVDCRHNLDDLDAAAKDLREKLMNPPKRKRKAA
jgi:hypothetical protein